MSMIDGRNSVKVHFCWTFGIKQTKENIKIRTHHDYTSEGNFRVAQTRIRKESLLCGAFSALPGPQLPQNLGHGGGTFSTGD